ncbi:hypothetical protein AX17_001607 [Amanita inopinata Kibby_2008]|nr:hypothetical protein AX17_001607 [Amanita inopinata Kibby_2008]
MSQPLPRIMIDNTYGAELIGAIVSAMMYGITNLQTYFYYMTYPNDAKENKILVFSIWLLDTLQMALVSITVYHYLITNYDNPPALGFGHWALFLSVAVNVLIAFIVQCFFTVRIFRLCGTRLRWWVAAFIAVMVVAHLGFGLETVVYFFIKKELKKLSEVTLIAAMPFALFAVLSDIVIAAALCILLHTSRTPFARTNAIISTLIIYAINRCLLTSVVAVIEVIVFAAAPHTLWFVGIDFVIGKLYANSLLATLNSRRSIHELDGHSINSGRFSDIAFHQPSATAVVTSDTQQGHFIQLRSDVRSDSRRSQNTEDASTDSKKPKYDVSTV